ncbi:transmembrane protein, putative [Medicago truncatula]|uniref:Transmembrane protein, putative n=1 Tax=Medicago truncatula TaxID=3880 RepID=G7IZY9_MEDTR|nr:transmembrane protein, putative [Medicago truncatula]
MDHIIRSTRLIITKMGKFVLEGRVISDSNIGEKVFIPRLSLTPSDNRIPFKFKRSQGQSLEHVGVYLPSPIFSHGQLYVALSRATSRGGLKILINDDDGDDTDVASNVVYREVFRNVFCYSHPWRLTGLNSHRISESANIICILLMEMWIWGYAEVFFFIYIYNCLTFSDGSHYVVGFITKKLEGLVLSRNLQIGFVVTLEGGLCGGGCCKKALQFLLSVSFAITINKSQGQSLKHVGVYLPSPVFSHGQLYVAI